MFAEVMKMREEEKKQSSRKLGMQRFFKKRWVYPAVYITAAALILTSVLWYQSRGNEATDPSEYGYDGSNMDGDAVEVTRGMETFAWPVLNPDQVEVKKKFYDAKASEDEQVAALVFYDNTYHPNTGIDIGMENGESFDVVAAMSGEVINVEEDSLLGNKIVIEHGDGIVTQYQSVKDIQVQVGDKVKQGQKIATAGKSMINEEAGVHVHFEIRKDNVPVNPLAYFKKSLNDVKSEQASKVENDDEMKNGTEGEDQENSGDEDQTDDQDNANDDANNDDRKDENNSDSSSES